ncbi:hypothetical protein AB0O64_27100 [Streptomyces sp. NPDC088341]|uniref:hypothetical protein n=1 Tax=Streptomyces sp. NPDC088341 TaxID=3154870 RepID=UPI0034475251
MNVRNKPATTAKIMGTIGPKKSVCGRMVTGKRHTACDRTSVLWLSFTVSTKPQRSGYVAAACLGLVK